ncbi:MAG TPA: chromosome segregation protein SMC, partial [Nitrococcus sp.]|nr:chromosome segregation protein SMC [Nitrococcus sp.]
MRLSKIKLAGFKSFVEPTTVPLPGGIVGIVGPNGCGKSNIIDAVRWVMGESSAKHLRGESMVDVIFNGSDARKPVGTASIELIFDNTGVAAGDKYAAYSEISIRRQVNREGQSTYHLNGTRCRRRDITDIFLGTGLGPRSYSLIEQSMIARIIEARPEELRAHLEEAAGISLYKDRRKETERRMLDTQENLARLDDIRSELGRQLDKLKRQAQAAERYRMLRAKQRERQAQLHVLKLQALDKEQQLMRRELAVHERDLEAQLAHQRALEHKAEDERIRYAECNSRVNEIQARYYAAGSDITRIEQQIQHRRELREANRQELERNREALLEIEHSLGQDRDKLMQLESQLQELLPAVAEAVAAEQTAAETVEAMRRQLEQWRQRWDRFSEEAAQPAQVVQVERARIEQLEQRLQELAQRHQRLQEEAVRLIQDDPQAELERLSAREQVLLEQVAELQQRHREQQARIGEQRERLAQLNHAVDEIRERLQRDRARLTSLEAIQQAALGEDKTVKAWLNALDLDSERRLAQWLDVEPGWEHAVEAVLGPALQAIVTQCAGLPGEALSSPCTGAVMLFSPATAAMPARPAPARAQALRDKVNAPWQLDDLLGHVYCIDDLESATTLAANLDAHESVVTPEGIWLGRRWARMRGTDNPAAGIIERERELQSLRSRVAVEQERVVALQSDQGGLRSELAGAESGLDALREESAERQRDLAGARAQLESRRHRQDEIHRRRSELDRELEEVAEATQAATEIICTARERLQEALTQGATLDRERVAYNEERQQLQAQLAAAQGQFNELQARRHALNLQEQSATTARAALEESISRLDERCQRLLTRDAQIEEALAELDAPAAELEREQERLAGERNRVEEQLAQARQELGESERCLRELEPQRVESGQRVLALRQALESVRLRGHELTVRAQSQAEQLDALGQEPEAVAAGLDPELTEPLCAQELLRLEEQITRLEPVNLAAIDECKALEERKHYLEGQHADLTSALETLENAIRRIDQETRRRFKETFEQVDRGLRDLFPRLFGGGQAHLELVGEDLLEAAVT